MTDDLRARCIEAASRERASWTGFYDKQKQTAAMVDAVLAVVQWDRDVERQVSDDLAAENAHLHARLEAAERLIKLYLQMREDAANYEKHTARRCCLVGWPYPELCSEGARLGDVRRESEARLENAVRNYLEATIA